jgi:hypothetical protein
MAEFTYNASALGAGGVIQRGNVTTVIPSLASVALAPTGGKGTSVCSYTSPELSFSYAETSVYGAKTGDEEYTTSTYVLIRDLNLFGVLTVRQMGAVVTSTRNAGSGDDHEFDVKVWYEDVAVNGHSVKPVYDEEVKGCRSYLDFKQLVLGEPYNHALVQRLGADTPQLQTLFNNQLNNEKAVQATVVKSLTCEGPIGPGNAHVLPIPGIGLARFGELMFKPGRRRLNLLRLQLNADLGWFFPSPDAGQGTIQSVSFAAGQEEAVSAGPGGGGSMTIASVEGNGSLLVP